MSLRKIRIQNCIGTDPDIPYMESVDPGQSNGYADQWSERAGAHWSFRNDAENASLQFPASKPKNPTSGSRNQPSPAVPYTENSKILIATGVGAWSDVIVGGDMNDKAVRFIGDDQNCLKIDNLSPEDKCMTNPSACHLLADGTRGFSVSFWLNLPKSFDQSRRYIFDTGATKTGNPGVSISYTNSENGSDLTNQLTVLVSTGSQYWEVVLTDLLAPYTWSNLGIRFSPSLEPSTNLVYGLQIFINKTSAAWTRQPTDKASSQNQTTVTHWSVGCRLDGQASMIGRLDELTVWYWRLRDSAVRVPNKPSENAEYGEIEIFDGNLKFAKINGLCYDIDCLPGAPVDAPDEYYERNSQVATQQTAGDTDESAAIEGDCNSSPSTWNGHENMIYCVDTVSELKEVKIFSPNYKALPFLHALVRILNKAPNPLKKDDLDYLYTELRREGIPRLINEMAPESLDRNLALQYMDIIYVLSKLTESKYAGVWYDYEFNNQPGITGWANLTDQWLSIVSHGLITDNTEGLERHRAGNRSATAIFKLQSQQITGDILFPNYASADLDQAFWKVRNATWHGLADTIKIPTTRIMSYEKYASLWFVLKIHNLMNRNMPAFLDQRINGLGSSAFFINSHVMSVSMNGTSIFDQMMYKENPVQFTVQHHRQQDDRPFLKAGLICARWKYADDDQSIGAWDTEGCKLMTTDDQQSTCQCDEYGEYALLMEKYSPPDAISKDAYDAPLILYLISIICCTIHIVAIVVRKGLHYEMHFIHSNLAFAMMLALIFYASTMKANHNKAACILVSAFVQYAYISAYAWFALSAHYVCRAVVSGRLGRVVFSYTLIGWGAPGIVVAICIATRSEFYGFGTRCFGSQSQNFLSVYLGIFLALCALVLVMLIVAVCNLSGKAWANKNPHDWSDVKSALFGLALMWPLFALVWVMAVCVYLIPQPYQAFDFCFEIFNSLQGVAILICMGFVIPSFRQAFFCRHQYEQDMLLAEENRRQKIIANPYFD